MYYIVSIFFLQRVLKKIINKNIIIITDIMVHSLLISKEHSLNQYP